MKVQNQLPFKNIFEAQKNLKKTHRNAWIITIMIGIFPPLIYGFLSTLSFAHQNCSYEELSQQILSLSVEKDTNRQAEMPHCNLEYRYSFLVFVLPSFMFFSCLAIAVKIWVFSIAIETAEEILISSERKLLEQKLSSYITFKN